MKNKNGQNGIMFVPFTGIETKEILRNGEKCLEIQGWASTFGNVDYGNDVCVKGCFIDSLKERDPKFLWQHQWSEPIGVSEGKEQDKGLWLKAYLPLSDTMVSGRVAPQVKVGSVDSMSIGYTIVESHYDSKTDVLYLDKLDLWEVSLVTFPMNPQAKVEAVKQIRNEYIKRKSVDAVISKKSFEIADIEYKWDNEKSAKRLEDLKEDQDEMIKSVPIFDVIDEKVFVIPRAMFALKAQILGAKGGFDGDEVIAKEILNKYYEKMDLQAPFKNDEILFCETEIKNMPLSELSFVLRNNKISKSCADMIARKLLSVETDGKPDESGLIAKAIELLDDDINEMKNQKKGE